MFFIIRYPGIAESRNPERRDARRGIATEPFVSGIVGGAMTEGRSKMAGGVGINCTNLRISRVERTSVIYFFPSEASNFSP